MSRRSSDQVGLPNGRWSSADLFNEKSALYASTSEPAPRQRDRLMRGAGLGCGSLAARLRLSATAR